MTRPLGILRGALGRVALLDMDTSLVEHAHPHCHIILKTSGPDQDFHVAAKVFPVRDDTAVLVNTWEPHHYVHRPHDCRTKFLALYIEPRWLAEVDRSFASCSDPAFFARSCVVITEEMRHLRQALARRIEDNRGDDIKEMEALTLRLMLELVHRFTKRRSYSTGNSARAPAGDFRIRRAARHMRENATGALDLDKVAQVAGLSRPHFNHLFRACTGVSPGVFADAIRVETAVRVLSEPHHSLGRISNDLGYSAQSNFTRFFQQHTGIAPSQFRRALAAVD